MHKGKRIIAIIPARSGSKGLPDKNIKELNGKPLVAYSIEAAIKSNVFDYIIVSTNSEKYAQISKKFGAHVPFLRSSENSTDTASPWNVCIEVLNSLKEKFDIVVLLQPTSPLRTSKNIKEALDLFFEKNADVVTSVTKVPHPLEWYNHLPESQSLYNFEKHENKNKRRQDFKPAYKMNGAIYIFKSGLLETDFDLCCKNSYAYIMDEEKSVDIDSELDFITTESIIKYYGSMG